MWKSSTFLPRKQSVIPQQSSGYGSALSLLRPPCSILGKRTKILKAKRIIFFKMSRNHTTREILLENRKIIWPGRWLGSYILLQFSSVQSLRRFRLFATPWIAARQASLSITNSWSLLKLMPIESVMPSSHLILCHPLLFLPPIPPSIRVFSNESALLMRWPKYWSFSLSISPSKEHPGLISFGMDWLDLLAVQGTLKNLLQHHSSKASIFRCSAFFTVQLSHPYMTTGKIIALTKQTFVGKVMSLLYNMLSRLVLTFLSRSKVSFNFMAAVTICPAFA